MHISHVYLVIKPLSRRHLCSRTKAESSARDSWWNAKNEHRRPCNTATGILLISAHKVSLHRAFAPTLYFSFTSITCLCFLISRTESALGGHHTQFALSVYLFFQNKLLICIVLYWKLSAEQLLGSQLCYCSSAASQRKWYFLCISLTHRHLNYHLLL